MGDKRFDLDKLLGYQDLTLCNVIEASFRRAMWDRVYFSNVYTKEEIRSILENEFYHIEKALKKQVEEITNEFVKKNCLYENLKKENE